ncbi:MAG: PqqD family protein [Microbacter sp.]
MNFEQLKALKSHFVSKEVGDELVLVPLTNNVVQMNELFTLNETGRFIWQNSDNVEDIDRMATLMTDAFDIDRETAQKDISNFLDRIATLFIKKRSL